MLCNYSVDLLAKERENDAPIVHASDKRENDITEFNKMLYLIKQQHAKPIYYGGVFTAKWRGHTPLKKQSLVA